MSNEQENARHELRIGEDIHPEILAGSYAARIIAELERREATGKQVIVLTPNQIEEAFHIRQLANYLQQHEFTFTEKIGGVTRHATWGNDRFKSTVTYTVDGDILTSGISFRFNGDLPTEVVFTHGDQQLCIDMRGKAYKVNDIPFKVKRDGTQEIGITLSKEEIEAEINHARGTTHM